MGLKGDFHMKSTIHLSATTSNAVPELKTALAERLSGSAEVMEAAEHYRSSEALAFRDTQGLSRLSQVIQSDPDLQSRAFREKEALKADITQNFRSVSAHHPDQSPRMYEMHHEMRVAEQCFAIHMAEAIDRGETPSPEDAGRFARARLGMTIDPEDFYSMMNLIVVEKNQDDEPDLQL